MWLTPLDPLGTLYLTLSVPQDKIVHKVGTLLNNCSSPLVRTATASHTWQTPAARLDLITLLLLKWTQYSRAQAMNGMVHPARQPTLHTTKHGQPGPEAWCPDWARTSVPHQKPGPKAPKKPRMHIFVILGKYMYINTFSIPKMIYLTFFKCRKRKFSQVSGQARLRIFWSPGRASVSPAWPGECLDLNMTKCW